MTIETPLLLGIDGGGTSCRARIVAVDGMVLGEGRAGSANVRLGLDHAFGAVLAAAGEALEAAGLDAGAMSRLHAGLGLAGVNLAIAFDEAMAYPLPFAGRLLATDTEIARLGAHGGGDGGIVILGTGSCAEARIGDRALRLGGRGFTLGDQGSGAAIGRAALRHALLAHDGLAPDSALCRALLAEFGPDIDVAPDAMIIWAEQAAPSDYARFSPAVLAHADRGDPVAIGIVREAAAAADQLILGLQAAGTERIAMLGGMAAGLRPWLAERTRACLVEPEGSALDGALLLARRQLAGGEGA